MAARLESGAAKVACTNKDQTMMDEGDDGARVGLWVTLGVVTLLLFGLVGGLAVRQSHKHAAPARAVATTPAANPVAAADVLLDQPLSGDLLGKVYFDTSSAEVPLDAVTAVDAAKTALAAAPASSRLVLSGFHDATGDPAKNADLAKERAKAVRKVLSAGGIDPARLALRKPEATTGDGKPEEARRVEIRLVP
jgi:outer membrane protein OmpA-like peptidoglycan-associated protein